MDNSFTDSILNPSLELIKNDSKIKRFYFLPWLLSVVFLSVLLVYQVVYTYVVLLGNKDAAAEIVLEIFHSQYATEILISSAIFVVFYIFLTPIFEGGLIRYIQKKSQGEASRSESIGFGIFRFYPLFEFNNIFNMFKFISIINGARYEIVLENKGVFESIGTSSQIALLNIKTTLKLYVLMFIMNIKVVLNFIIFLIFPIMSAFILWFITSQTFATIAIVLLGAVFVFLILVLGYMAAVLEVFTTSIWYNAYKQWKAKLAEAKIDS